MIPPDISKSRNADIRASLGALQRAAELARQIAIQTNTPLVVVREGKLVLIPPDELRAESELREAQERAPK